MIHQLQQTAFFGVGSCAVVDDAVSVIEHVPAPLFVA
jgi:hypothetical protein